MFLRVTHEILDTFKVDEEEDDPIEDCDTFVTLVACSQFKPANGCGGMFVLANSFV